ncbi:nitroreductase family deazaflavin-dependent oxidoreductase [Amycolatopsis sp. DSM 110486]|uniref:nitroreductase family deazaflavin-dependent oxidoreductase n=1 Tax=Amycolatopsis sp. DSM 110486 TaxID=2865832 RepID=UPI001C69CB11|nr:nitroreductase family deazaflavin-dependent oxidoreductase [Amycolatopsis sp. DSM 110486]QYN18411.1 nitroreductase family deazaflavin-dependent oxidoreductase [Amycolatopsis sp. DSM 110486]
MPVTDRPPTGLLRWFLRAPIPWYRWGFGKIFGHRLLYLVHRGRKSGARREVVVEVVRHRPDVPELLVIAAWGGVPQWYRNLRAAPAIEVRCGGYLWREPRRRFLDGDELDEVLREYRRAHPRAWAKIGPRLGFPADPEDPLWTRAVDRVHGVAFLPASR